MSDIQKGNQITLVFKYIQQVCEECKQLIFKIDSLLAPELSNLYGNRITSEVSANLQTAKRWIIQAIFRTYENEKDGLVNKGITITFWDKDLEQPIITAGKIVYNDLSNRGYWDLWNIWFRWEEKKEKNDFKADGRINHFKSDKYKHIEEAYVFSLPLVSISDENELIEKIIKPLKEL